jgi:undecaprenyl-diphosphatase
MNILQSIFLGALQGITEFLPVSSSAHLIIVPSFLHIDEGNVNQLTFDVMLHFGTLLAILLIYGRKFAVTVAEGLRDLRQRRGKFWNSLLLKLAVATCPAVIIGLLGNKFIEAHLRTPHATVPGLIAVSIVMIVAERLYVSGRKITWPVAVAIGFAQSLALVPGVSRSGITITAGMLLGLRRHEAVDFSFLLSIPIIMGSFVYELRHLQLGGGNGAIYITGVLSSFIFGAVSLQFLVKYLKKHSLDVFACYRIFLALAILLFAKY